MILNLTQHDATPDQIDAGVRDIKDPAIKDQVRELLTFDNPPTRDEIMARANTLANYAVAYRWFDDDTMIMIGGALWLMAPLARELRTRGLYPLFAFSQRKSVEVVNDDNSVTKSTVFVHEGFVPATE